VTVDYPEHDLEEVTGETVSLEIKEIQGLLDKLLRQFEKGRLLREGINVVIAGRPNVGKSSLLNYLAGKEKALVTDIPGTTRDIIDEYISIKGIPVRIVDTAGIRETADVIEKLGVAKTLSEIEGADLIILMLEAEIKPNADEIKLINDLSSRRHIIVINKIDNAAVNGEAGLAAISMIPEGRTVVETSLTQDRGIDKLEEKIADMFMAGNLESDPDILLTNLRHKLLVEKAKTSLDRALEAHREGMPLDIMTMDIRDAAQYIGEITGQSVSESVIEEIFSRFCIGK
jgi:tRNA modification GTPase